MKSVINAFFLFGILSDLLLILEGLLIAFFIFKSKQKNFWFFFFFLSFFFSFLLATVLKIAFPEQRPLATLGIKEEYDSFPSRHALISSTLAFSSLYLNPKLGVINILISVLIGLFRILGYYHWPWDVFAGFLLGLIVTLLLKEFYLNKNQKAKLKK